MRRVQRCCNGSALAAAVVLLLFAGAALAQGTAVQQAGFTKSSAQTSQAPLPSSPEQVGDALMMHQRYQAAIEAYKKSPTLTSCLWNKMGIAYQLMFNQSEAMRSYQAALRMDPHNTHALNNLGTLYDSERRYGDAERMYRRALAVEPKSAMIEKNLGTALLAQHKYKKGWEAYQAALAIDPEIFENDPGLRVDNPASVQERGAMNYYMARGCVRAGMNEQAIEYLRKALTEGFITPKKLVEDNEFARLRGLPEFETLLSSAQRAQ